MSRKRFYISFFVSVVLLALAAGLTTGIHLNELAKRVLWGILLSAIAGSAAAPTAGRWISKFDRLFAGWGMDPEEEDDPKGAMISGALAAAIPVFAAFMILYYALSPFIAPEYILKGRLSDNKLLALAAADEYSFREVAGKYNFSMDGTDLGRISEAAVSRLRSPDKIREAAVILGTDYRPIQGDSRSEAFLKAISRLNEMHRQDHIARVYFGLKEYGKDRGIGAPIGAMIKIMEISSNETFLEGVISDVTTPPEVRAAAEKRMREL